MTEQVPTLYRADSDMDENRYHYFFIHNVFGHFFHDSLDYFSSYLYPRFEWTVCATYDKAVEYIEKTKKLGREADAPNLPAIILNPSGEFGLDDPISTSKQMWRFPNLAPGLIKRIYQPIYQDPNMIINVGFTRVKGEMELLLLSNSFYEYCDLRIYMLQVFGGQERYIHPIRFNSFIVIPDELKNYRYQDVERGIDYELDWENNGASNELILTTAKTELVYPCVIKPRYRLMGLADGSERYGGTDSIADWRLTATVEYEVEIPSFMILESDYLVENIEFVFGYGSAFSENEQYGATPPPVNKEIITSNYDSELVEGEDGRPVLPNEVDSISRDSLLFRNRYVHIVTQAEVDSTSHIDIEMPEQVQNRKYLTVIGKDGELTYGKESVGENSYHWTLIQNGQILRFNKNKVTFQVGEIVELYVYGDMT